MIERSWRQMASPIVWMMDAPPSAEWIDPLYDRLRALFAEVERRLSRFQEGSDLVQLNHRVGEWVSVSPLLYHAMRSAFRAWELTDGAFDPRVIVDLERLGYKGAEISMREVFDPGPWLQRRPIGYWVRILAPIDLGGIGKSLAVLWGARLLARFFRDRNQDIPPMLLNAGGDLQMLGTTVPELHGWMIGIEHPEAANEYALVLNFTRPAAVCTSSVRRNRWQHEGRWVHHLIDPAAHEPGGSGLVSVTVAHMVPTWAEIWSKALFLQGSGSISSFAQRHNLAAWWIYDDGTWGALPSAMQNIAWIRPEMTKRPG